MPLLFWSHVGFILFLTSRSSGQIGFVVCMFAYCSQPFFLMVWWGHWKRSEIAHTYVFCYFYLSLGVRVQFPASPQHSWHVYMLPEVGVHCVSKTSGSWSHQLCTRIWLFLLFDRRAWVVPEASNVNTDSLTLCFESLRKHKVTTWHTYVFWHCCFLPRVCEH